VFNLMVMVSMVDKFPGGWVKIVGAYGQPLRAPEAVMLMSPFIDAHEHLYMGEITIGGFPPPIPFGNSWRHPMLIDLGQAVDIHVTDDFIEWA
jgi:hypothetical protein